MLSSISRSFINDPKLFKKLHDEIWEFRVKYKTIQIRLLSFWDKRDGDISHKRNWVN
ncbi:hypothetical protein D4S03_03500 [bacterium]|nr:MAG: hypothetical protein D4S03_03500 [bacterium]